ncbi:MAG: HlyD family efflux transporter periplasmic adaptor subunit [Polyangia bacterium]|jgi:membrane fusion protein (multidrug efflux system)
MFARFARAQDASSRVVVVGVVGGILLAAWSAWFFLARVGLYEVSRSARLEVATAPYDVDSPVAARLLRSALVLDRQVQQGEILVELDAEAFRLERAAEQSRLATLGPQIEALRHELASQEQAMRGEGRASAAQVNEARARLRASDVVAQQKESERARIQTLHDDRLVPTLDRDRMRTEAQRQSAEAEAAREQVGRLGSEGAVKLSERRAQIARLQADVARLQSERADAESKLRILDQKIDLHLVRAPIAGRIGHMVNLRAGAMVSERTRLCTIVPTGGLRAVAFFDPATAIGRVRTGQSARLRMFGFPWTKYGLLQAQVDRVGNEPRDGLIRVELVLRSPQRTNIPLQHGLPGSAEVEVEQVSPFALVLDAAGRFLISAEASAAPAVPNPAPTQDR